MNQRRKYIYHIVKVIIGMVREVEECLLTPDCDDLDEKIDNLIDISQNLKQQTNDHESN